MKEVVVNGITCVGFMHLKDGRVVPLDELTPEELERCTKSMKERSCRVMSEYYANHPEEYEKLS